MKAHLNALLALAALNLSVAACGNLSEHKTIVHVEYTPDNQVVAFLDGEVRLLDANGERTLRSIAFSDPDTGRAQISADGSRIAVVVGNTIEVYEVATGSRIAHAAVPGGTSMDVPDGFSVGFNIAISARGDQIALASIYAYTTPPRLLIWRPDPNTFLEIARQGVPGESNGGIAFAPTGEILYAAFNSPGALGANGEPPPIVGSLSAWTTSDGTRLWQTSVPATGNPSSAAPVASLAASASGEFLATSGWTIDRWRTSDGSHDDGFSSPVKYLFYSVAISPDASRIAVGGNDNQVPTPQVFNRDGSLLRRWPSDSLICWQATFSPDGARLAAACSDIHNGNWLMIWGIDDGNVVQRRQFSGQLF